MRLDAALADARAKRQADADARARADAESLRRQEEAAKQREANRRAEKERRERQEREAEEAREAQRKLVEDVKRACGGEAGWQATCEAYFAKFPGERSLQLQGRVTPEELDLSIAEAVRGGRLDVPAMEEVQRAQ